MAGHFLILASLSLLDLQVSRSLGFLTLKFTSAYLQADLVHSLLFSESIFFYSDTLGINHLYAQDCLISIVSRPSPPNSHGQPPIQLFDADA